MFKNYLKIAFRNLFKYKLYSFINITGLSIGFVACLLILQYVSFELSYDSFNKNSPNIYRVYNDRYQNGKLIQHGTITYSAIGKAMQDDFPEVINHTRVVPFGKMIITNNNKKVAEQNVLAVDNSFLSMFSYPLIVGDTQTALNVPYSVIISETSAKQIFNIESNNYTNLPGKVITIGTDPVPYKITGIFKDVPENSHLKFDILISYSSLLAGLNPYKKADYDFTDSNFWHYIQLRHGVNYKTLEAKFEAFSKRHFDGNKVSGSFEKFYLQPLLKAHLYSDFEYEIGNTGNATVVWGLFLIAGLIILIAWVNYINFATAKSIERAKEVGIRKVVGATNKQLIKQFLAESIVINILALIIAICIIEIVQSNFNLLIQHQLSLSYIFQDGLSNNIYAAFVVFLITGFLVSGLYPALLFSSFKPALVLKGKYSRSNSGIIFRKILVVGQFAVAVALIIGSFVVYRQIQFVSNQSLGMNISQVLIVKPPIFTGFDSNFIARENSFVTELNKIPGVQGASSSSRVPGDELGRTFNVHRIGINSNNHFTIRHMMVSNGFIELYGINVLSGRSLTTSDYNSDFNKLHNIVINESLVKLLGFSSNTDAIGKSIMAFNKKLDIIGVIKDFHQKSLKYPLEPTLLFPAYSSSSPISIKIKAQNLSSTIADIQKEYDEFFPGNLFEYYFLDEKFNEQYTNDQLFGKVFGVFSGFAIFIASLGLLGLSLFATSQRIKEIGVRKVLGASVLNIVVLLSKDFLRLVVIASLIAIPVAWYLMNNWLQNYAYRIDIDWWIFASAGFAAILIAFLTVSIQAIQAARQNPVESLKYE